MVAAVPENRSLLFSPTRLSQPVADDSKGMTPVDVVPLKLPDLAVVAAERTSPCNEIKLKLRSSQIVIPENGLTIGNNGNPPAAFSAFFQRLQLRQEAGPMKSKVGFTCDQLKFQTNRELIEFLPGGQSPAKGSASRFPDNAGSIPVQKSTQPGNSKW